MIPVIPVILSGGSGTRLWSLSRGQYPKQFLPLISKYTLLQDTLLRLSGLAEYKHHWQFVTKIIVL